LGVGGGPEKTILLGASKANPDEFCVTVCYIRDARDKQFNVSSRAHTIGVDYVEILERHSFDVRILRQLSELIRARSIDLIHSHDYKTDFLALLIAFRGRVIPVATVHGWIRNSWRERCYYVADRWLLRWFPVVIAVSGHIRDTLIEAGVQADRVVAIPNGVDHVSYRPAAGVRERVRSELGLGLGTIVLGAVGRLEPEKRFDLLLRLAAELKAANIVVVIAGEGSMRPSLISQAASLGLTPRLLLLGQRMDVRDLLQAFDVYVQTSDTEGIPNAVLEAMATETPVVATNVGGTSELIEDGTHGLLVPRGDVAALTAAVSAVLDDPVLTRRRVAAARDRIERQLSFDTRMRRVEAIYSDLYQNSRRSP
jgi:glycosyltransferase involved in cell wall biosynthesis